MIQKRPFMFPVYKDQTVGANAGKIVQTGDTVSVLVKNHDGTETVRDLVLVGVEDAGKSILYDTTDEKNFRVEDITRVHAKHEYNCPGEKGYTLVVTSNSTTLPTSVTGITIGGVSHPLSVAEAAGAAALEAGFAQKLADALNGLISGNGYAYVVSQAGEVATVKLVGTTLVPTALTVVNATQSVTVIP